MCGFAGFFRSSSTPDQQQNQRLLEAMGNAILHRGPDAGATYQDDYIGLVHRRLSILDLSDAGTQPMHSASGRYVIAFNGEIYNFQSIKQELIQDGFKFKTQTDTEVLLALFEKVGFRCLDKLNGMFAIAIWDKQARELFLARDRLGKKPLYYYHADNEFIFASEIKSILKLPFTKRQLRYDALKDFFSYQYIPDPKTIYQGIDKLKPGHWLKTNGSSIEIQSYWDISFNPLVGRDLKSIEEELYEKIDDAVRLRMISDVPLGAFLSGGVDSSAIVGLMAGHSSEPITTCSIGFDSRKFDEVQFAQKVAEQFKTDHHEFTVRENVADNLTAISSYFDEPFADPSFVPTFFVSQLARQKVTVALAGDGGDENFAGYSKYHTDSIENRLRSMFPGFIRRGLFPSLAQLSGLLNMPPARKAQSLLNTLALDADKGFYISNCFFRQSVWDQVVAGELATQTKGYDPADITVNYYHEADAEDHLSRVLYADLKTFLPGDILVKVDRMSMANSLETRAPLLDYRVVEFAASIPAALKLNGSEKKYILKQTFSGLLDEEILYRKKMGFSVPLADWLRKEIYETANMAFSSNNSGLSSCFDMNVVRSLWQSHLNGNDMYTQELWTMLAFELWWQAYGA